jgi:hypothetical protein
LLVRYQHHGANSRDVSGGNLLVAIKKEKVEGL